MDNEPAFPRPAFARDCEECPRNDAQPGMSLRDYFAAAALTGFIANPLDYATDDVAKRAYIFADAMLKQREGS